MKTLYAHIKGYFDSLPQSGVRVTAIRLQPVAANLIAAETCPHGLSSAANYERFLQEINMAGEGKMGELVFRGGAVGCDAEIEVIPRDSNLSKAWKVNVDENGAFVNVFEL